MLITRRLEFDAGHRIPDHKSQCRHLHGHRYAIEVTLSGDIIRQDGNAANGIEITSAVNGVPLTASIRLLGNLIGTNKAGTVAVQDEAGVAMYRNTWPKFGLGHGALAYLLIPWNFLAHGERFIDGYTLIGSPGPLLAALLPAAVLRLKGRGRTVALMAVAMLTACGGGGADSPASALSATPPQPVVHTTMGSLWVWQ